MSLLNASAYKINGGRITLPQILTISRDVQTQSNHVTTLTVSISWPELGMPGKQRVTTPVAGRTSLGRKDQQSDHLRR